MQRLPAEASPQPMRRATEFARNIIGFAVAPAAGVAAAVVMTLVWIMGAIVVAGADASLAGPGAPWFVTVVAWTIAAAVPVSYALALVVGLPLQIILILTRRRTLRAYALAGLCVGVVLAPLAGWALVAGASGMPLPVIVLAAIDLLVGAPTVATAFWLIARPDRSVDP